MISKKSSILLSEFLKAKSILFSIELNGVKFDEV
jgi:hypothetical protein